MTAKVELDNELVKEAVRLGRHRSRRAAVTEALREYTAHLRQQQVLDVFGTVDHDPDYDYKQQRQRS